MVIAKKVDLTSSAFKQLLERKKIKDEEVLKGTISSVLAENTRIFIEAIVPTMRCEPLSDGYDGPFRKSLLQTDHRIEAGSSRFLMNYAARVFVKRNGLKNMNDGSALDRIFQDAFVFFAREAIKGIHKEDEGDKHLVGAARRSLLEELSHKSIDENIFYFGVANRGEPTSRAMKYLSLVGSSFALVDGDELVFENAVPVHLSRLSTSLGRNQLGTYKLRAGVPNSKRKLNFVKLRKDVKDIRSKFPEDADDIRVGCPWSLVLLNFKNAAGPDTMELQLDVNDKGEVSGCLDVYQHKLKEETHERVQLMSGAISLGRSPDDLGFPNESTSTDLMDAKLVSGCLDDFVKVLEEKFGIAIAIRKRVIVIRPSASEVRDSEEIVLQGDVTVWTREFLEPTCSLLPPLDR